MNNPVRFVDPDGKIILPGASTRRANRMLRRLNRIANRLARKIRRREARGKNIGDMRERAAELKQSIQDIKDMQNDTKYWYRFEKVNSKNNLLRNANNEGLPVTSKTKENEITMFMSSFNNMHEPRHGGQIARGEYDIIGIGLNGEPTITYGAEEEISAYRAEYASMSGIKVYGSFSYLPKFKLSNEDFINLMTGKATMQNIYNKYKQQIRNINDINKNLLRNMYDTNGLNQTPIYLKYPDIWWNN
jgi:hypothetical protein